MSNTNRTKGHNFERYLAKIFREKLGFTFCKTSRQASRLLDASKVDLAFIPFNVQAKAVKANINYQDVFRTMDEALNLNFPPTDPQIKYPKIIFHKKGTVTKKDKYQSVVVMEENEFIELLNKIYNGKSNEK
jgi:hypothetical protein